MISAVDTSVLLDVFRPDPEFAVASRSALRQGLRAGGLVACEVVWAETGGRFPSPEAARSALDRVGIRFDPLDEQASLVAGAAWQEYRRRGGKREKVIADLLIGAHAAVRADSLITRDRGFFRTYFPDLKILDPTREVPEGG